MKTGTVTLIAYIFVCMFCQFFIYSWGSHYGKIAHDHFKDEFESEVNYFNWALENKLGAADSVIIAFVAALSVAVTASIILYFYSKTPSAGILLALTYLVVFFHSLTFSIRIL